MADDVPTKPATHFLSRGCKQADLVLSRKFVAYRFFSSFRLDFF